jgi:hypothetical protein
LSQPQRNFGATLMQLWRGQSAPRTTGKKEKAKLLFSSFLTWFASGQIFPQKYGAKINIFYE